MAQATLPALVIRRTYRVSPQRVYDAWTTPETIKQFLAPDDESIGTASLDVRTGGAYRITFNVPSGEV